MPCTIGRSTGDVRIAGTYGLSGSGFGTSQGETKFLLFDSAGAIWSLTPEIWSDTSITLTIPWLTPPATGPFFVSIQLEGEDVGTRSEPGDEILSALAIPTDYSFGTFVTLTPNAQGTPGIGPVM